MKRLFLLLFLLLSACGQTEAAVLVMNQNGTYTVKATLADAAITADAAGKTVVITTPQTLAGNLTWPSDRALKIEKGGAINQGAYTLTINGPFENNGNITGSGNVTLNGKYSGKGTITTSGALTYGKGSVETINPLTRGVTGDGSTNDTTLLQTVFSELPENSTLFFPSGNIFKFTEVTLSQKHVTLTGPGVIDGTIKIQASTTGIAANHLDMFANITGLRFHNLSARSNAAAIILINARRGSIAGNKFFGFQDAVRVPVNIDPTAWGGHVARWIITHNAYGFSADESVNSPNVDYFVRGLDSYSHGAKLSTADMTITDNEGTANITHIDIDSIDGLTEHGNTFTFRGYLGQSSVKAQSVKITYGAWLHIHDEKMWESGLEGLLLTQCTRYNVHDIMIAWPGQRLESAGIKVTGVPMAGNYYGQGHIHHNKIIEPTGHGIDVGAKEGRTAIDNNYLWKPGSSDRYYGVPALSGTQKLIITDTDTIGLKITRNDGTYKDYSLATGSGVHLNLNEFNTFDLVGDGGGIQYYNEPYVYTVTTESTLNITRVGQVNFNHGSATNFTQFTHTIGTYKLKNITCRFYNGNTTLVNGANMVLKGATNVTPAANAVMTFQVVDGVAVEMSRSF